ncbi:MAG: aspartate 1-decarboxylase [Calditrichia bacterium]|jgi:aspartate 1-decarboxylase
MYREFLKSKLHRLKITESNLHYSGSLTIDEELMEKAGIAPNERIHIFNINNGARFETYALKGERGSRKIGLNGAAARLGTVGDLIIVVTYCYLTEEEIPSHTSRVVIIGEGNEIEDIFES